MTQFNIVHVFSVGLHTRKLLKFILLPNSHTEIKVIKMPFYVEACKPYNNNQYFLILYILPLDEAIRKAEINRELKNEKNIYKYRDLLLEYNNIRGLKIQIITSHSYDRGTILEELPSDAKVCVNLRITSIN